MAGPSTGPSAMPRTEAERLAMVERAVAALRGRGEMNELAEIVQALAPLIQKPPTNGTATKVAWIAGAFAVCGIIGGYLAVEVIAQGKEITALRSDINNCVRKP